METTYFVEAVSESVAMLDCQILCFLEAHSPTPKNFTLFGFVWTFVNTSDNWLILIFLHVWKRYPPNPLAM